MSSYDFGKNLKSLIAAARGAADAIQLSKDKGAHDLVPTKGQWSACCGVSSGYQSVER